RRVGARSSPAPPRGRSAGRRRRRLRKGDVRTTWQRFPVRDAKRDVWRLMACTGGPACPFWGRRSALRVNLPRPTGWGIVPRYTYRRLSKLLSTADQLRRHTVLNLPGMLHGLSFEHTVMEPGAGVRIWTGADSGLLCSA